MLVYVSTTKMASLFINGNTYKINNTICLVLGRSMAWQPNIHKIAQSSLYSWTMYIIKEIGYCHLMLNSPARRWHLGFHFLFLNLAILHNSILVSAVYIY